MRLALLISQIHLQHHYIHRYGRKPLGRVFMLITQDCSWENIFFVVVDAHSKWPKVAIVSTSSTQITIDVLRSLFARYGLQEQLVSYNGSQFTSGEFEQFTRANGIRHIKSAPYHAASNGQVERFIQTIKHSLRASERDG